MTDTEIVLTLTAEDVRRLTVLITNACDEVDASVASDAAVQPDDPFALMASYDWGKAFLRRMGVEPPPPADPHVTGTAKCAICNNSWVFVAPEGTDVDRLECPRCGHMSGEWQP